MTDYSSLMNSETTSLSMRLSLRYMRYRLLVFFIIINAVYLTCTYYLLAVNNPFNFNNNFHLIGFVSFLTLLINLCLFLIFSRSYHQELILQEETAEAVTDTTIDPFEGITHFSASLMMIFFTLLPSFLYFLLINDFMLYRIIGMTIGLGLLAIGLLGFSYWQSLKLFMEKKIYFNWAGMINKAIILFVFSILFYLMLYFLTGMIPADAKPTANPLYSI